MSFDEEPIMTLNMPGSTVKFICLSHIPSSCGVSSKCTVCDASGFRVIGGYAADFIAQVKLYHFISFALTDVLDGATDGDVALYSLFGWRYYKVTILESRIA